MGVLTSLRAWTEKLTPFFIYLLLVGTLGPFLFGFHLAELNAPQDVISCSKKSIRLMKDGLPQCIPMGPTQIGLVSSIFTLGGLVGALGAGPSLTRYGRLIPMRSITAFFILGPVAESLAPNVAILSVGRFVSGLGAGASLVIVPIWVSEISPPDERGLFGAFTQIMTNTGIFSAQLLGYFLSYGEMWRIILAAGGLVGMAQLLGLMFAVDSPKWQADQGHVRRAKADLRRIRGRNTDISPETEGWNAKQGEHDGEQDELLGNQHSQRSNQETLSDDIHKAELEVMGFIDVIRHPTYHRAVLAVVAVMVAQQLCGINSIVMYGVSLLGDLLQSNSALLNMLVSLLNVVITTLCAPLPDKIGRKPCLLISIAGMGSSSILLGIGIRGSVPILSAVAVLLFVASFGVGLGPVPFILSSELVGPEAVGATQSWALAANWIATFLVAQFFPIINDKLGTGLVYFIFAGLAAVFLVFVMVWVPETKGKKGVDDVWGRAGRADDL